MVRKLSMEELNRISPQEFRNSEKIPVSVVLDNVRSMNNVGSVFRTSDAFRIEKIFLCGITATPPHKEIRKTALGATESVSWEYLDDSLKVVKRLKSDHYHICAIEQTDNSIPLNTFPYDGSEKLALVFGHEVRGVDQAVLDLCETVIEIPQYGTKHSLNISVSAGIVLWELAGKIMKSRAH
jgi:tRNA G18 (ribose-2'-O)-methylase SpoU